MQELDFNKQVQLFFGDYNQNPAAVGRVIQSVSELEKNGFLKDFLSYLLEHINLINPHYLFKHLRAIRGRLINTDNQELKELFGRVVVALAKKSISGDIDTDSKIQILKKYVRLLRRIDTDKYIDENDRVILNLLSSSKAKRSELLDKTIFDKLQREVFVDQKHKSEDAIELNRLLSPVVIGNFKEIFDTMKRLLNRSSSNLVLWENISSAIKDTPHKGEFILDALSLLQQQLSQDSQVCVTIINNLTHSVTDEETIIKFIDELERLINKTYDEGRKIVYLSMLKGIVRASAKFEGARKRALSLFVEIVSIVNSEEIYNVVSPIIREYMREFGGSVIITTEVLKVASKEIRDLAKYGCLVLSSIISLGTISEQILGSKELGEIIKEYTDIYQKNKNKIGTNTEYYLSAISILSRFNTVKEFPELLQSNYLMNYAFLSQVSETNHHVLPIFIRVIKNIPNLNHQHRFLAIAIYVSLNNSSSSVIPNISTMSKSQILWVLSEGIYPILFNELQKPLKLKWGKQYKVVSQLIKLIKEDESIGENINWERVLSILPYFNLDVQLLIKKCSNQVETIKSSVQQRVKEVIKAVLDQQLIITPSTQLYINFLQGSIKLGLFKQLQQFINIFFNKELYTSVKCLVDFDQDIESVRVKENARIEEEKQSLNEYQFPTKAKKGKIEVEEELKMLDENEVKQQILKKHYNKMVQYYNKLLTIIKTGMKEHDFQVYICTKYSQLLSCQVYPDVRFEFYAFNRELFNNEPQYRRYSEFLSELYLDVGMNTLPSARLLDKLNNFMSALLTQQLKDVPSHFINILEHLTQYILRESLDISLKLFAQKFYLRLAEEGRFHDSLINIYPFLIQNINLLSQYPETRSLIIETLKVIPEERVEELLDDLMNYLPTSQKASLSAISIVNRNYKLNFEDYVKLRILEVQDTDIAKLAKELLLRYPVILNAEQLQKFKMKRFVERHSKQVSEKLCSFAKEVISSDPNTISPFFTKAIETAKQLYEQKFDQEGLEFYPYFLMTNNQYIPADKLESIFEVLIKQYTSDDQMVSLNKRSMEAGIAIIKFYGKQHSEQLLVILEKLMKSTQGISSIIFLGVLAPFLKDAKNLNLIQKRITDIFQSTNENIQRSVAKCMHELMSFFEKPQALVADLYNKVTTVESVDQVGKSYLISGLLKGIGVSEVMTYLNKVLEPSENKNFIEKKGKLYVLSALLDNFGRAIQPKIIEIVKVIATSMSDNNNQSVRDVSKATAKRVITKLSAFGVRTILPQLLKGLEEQEHWRGKTTYIWILGNMSHCAPRQLHVCLPQIIPILSACLSDTHPKIRETATEALKVIGETIKNPEIFSIIDILINALSDLFHMSKKALEVLLKTRFTHFIDPPALSIIVPILNYALRGRDTVLKQYACQVIGSVVLLIENPNDLLPYFEFMSEGIRITLCDPLPEVRSYASRAIGKISVKIGIENTENYLPFVKNILASETATSIDRLGAAQGLSEYICSHGIQFFEDELNAVYKKLSVAKHAQKQGYISLFIFVPTIMKQDFEPFIKELTDNMTIFVSDEEESIRNSSLQVQKILINNYGLSHTQMLLEPLELSLFEEKWRKRNGALLLIGEMLNVLKSYLYDNIDAEKESNYYQALMGVYILKDDDVEMPRITANQVWNNYIENTPKTIKCGIPFLVRMWSKGISEPASNIVYRNIVAFCTKYAETYFHEIIVNLQTCFADDALESGAFEVLGEFIKRMSNIFLGKFKDTFRSIFDHYMFQKQEIKPKLIAALSIFIEKMHEAEYFENKIIPILAMCDSLNEESNEFSRYLHLFGALSSTTSKSITEMVAEKILENPLSEFKIEVLVNNSAKLANYAYSKGILNVLRSELESEIDKDSLRLKSLVYCLKQLSVNIDVKNQEEFLKELSNDIREKSRRQYNDLNEKEQKMLEIQLDVLNHYLESVSSENTPSLEELVQEITPLCLVDKESLIEVVNKIMLRLFMHPDAKVKSSFFKQFIVCMDNNNKIRDRVVIPIWKDEASVKSYTTLLINSFCYGGMDALDSTLSLIETFLKIANPQFVRTEAIRFIGATLRVSNYRMTRTQKLHLHEFIHLLYAEKFPMHNFQYQVVFTLIKFLEQTQDDSNIQLTANNFAELLLISNKKSEVISEFITGITKGKGYLIKCLNYLIKRVIKEDILNEGILSKLYNDIHSLVNENSKMQIESIYNLCHISGQLAVHLKVPKEKFSTPLQGVTFSFAQTLEYLVYSHYEGSYPQLIEKVNVFLKDSSRQKVHYILRGMVDAAKKQPKIKEKYKEEVLKGMINETILGFEEIEDCLREFSE